MGVLGYFIRHSPANAFRKEHETMTKIAIVGPGAAGSYIGAFLTRAGHDVTLFDQWPEHVETMRSQGLRASGSQGDFTVPVKAMHLHDLQSVDEQFDIVFLSVKSYDTEWATHFIKPYVKPTGFIVSAQNCMNDELIASIVGFNRQVPLVMSSIEVALWEPGHVTRGGEPGTARGYDVFRSGETNGTVSKRIEDLMDMMRNIDNSKATTNIWGERWCKLATNCMGNPVGGISGLGATGQRDNANARKLAINLAKETVQVGSALGFNVEPVRGVDAETWNRADDGEVFEEIDAKMLGRKADVDWRSSMAQDVYKGRRSEIDFMNGYVVRKGREANVPTPASAAVVEGMHRIDSGAWQQDPANIDKVLADAGLL